MQSKAETVDEYIAGLPEDRREQISVVRRAILDNLPEGIEETMNWGMISYEVPLEDYPDTYNGQPLMYAALASQKNHMAVYLTGIYSDEKLRDDFIESYKQSGKKLDMGKSCVRFKQIDDLPVFLIGKAIGAVAKDEFIAHYEATRGRK
jgi:uncharacterized protein YdhG (YjbR/CyaY superfamily)